LLLNYLLIQAEQKTPSLSASHRK